MQTKHPVFSDMAKLASGAIGAAHGVKQEIENTVRAFIDRRLDVMNIVTREEFDAVKDMAIKARKENEALREALDALRKSQDPDSIKSDPKA